MVKDFQAKRDPGGFNSAFFDGAKLEAMAFLEALTAMPFLSEKRLVVAEKFFTKANEDLHDAIYVLIEEKRMPESTVAIFWEEEIKVKNAHPLLTYLLKQPYSAKFEPLTSAQLMAWINKQAGLAGVQMERRVLDYLVMHPLAQEMWQFTSELDKLLAYGSQLENKTITSKEVELLWPPVVDENIFHLTDALLAKNSKLALKLLHDQWADAKPEPVVFGTFVWQFKTLLQIKDYTTLNPGLTSDMAAKSLGLHPFVVKKSIAVLRGFSMDKLKEIYRQLLDIDIKQKTSSSDLKTLLDFLVVKICN